MCHVRRAGKGRLKGWHQSAKASVVRMWDVNVRRRTAAATATGETSGPAGKWPSTDDTFPPYGQITTGVLCKSSPWPVWATA